MTPLIPYLRMPPEIPDLGLGYLATALRKGGHEVLVEDWNPRLGPDALTALLASQRPAVVGLKVFTKDAAGARRTIALVRRALPGAVILIGGPHPSACEPESLMADFDQADYALRGEAEATLPALLEILAEREGALPPPDDRLRQVSGLVWRGAAGVLANEVRLNADLNSVDLPSWDLIDPRTRHTVMMGANEGGPVAPIVTTRGCPGLCTYCSAFTVNGRKIRARSPQNVFDEIRMLHDTYGVRRFMFMDNCFTSIRDHLTGLCRLIIESGLAIEWDCASYETLKNLTDENLALMRRAGCTMIHMGIESGSERIRATINKRSELAEITEKVGAIKRSGIRLTAWFMLGFPDERLVDMLQTIRYAFGTGADHITFGPVLPLPGSAVCRAMQERHALGDIRWSRFEELRSPYPLSRLAPWQLTLLLAAAHRAVRLRDRLRRPGRAPGPDAGRAEGGAR